MIAGRLAALAADLDALVTCHPLLLTDAQRGALQTAYTALLAVAAQLDRAAGNAAPE